MQSLKNRILPGGLSNEYICPAISPPADATTVDDVDDGRDAPEEENPVEVAPQGIDVLDVAADQAELELMDRALREGKGYDEGASISDGMLCGPAEDDG